MRRYLPFVIVGAVAVILAGSLTMLYRAKRLPSPTAGTAKDEPGLHVRGENSAPVTLEEFGDFECPPCGKIADILLQVEKNYGSKLRVIFRQFPLEMHAHAREAAWASEAAHLQNKFWEMHDLLYREQAVWSKSTDVPGVFKGYARQIGLDVERFEKDMASTEVRARVDADQKLGLSRGVTSTPTLFINNTVLPATSLNPPAIHAAIDEALKPKAKP